MAMCWGWALGLDFHGSTVKVNFVNREGGAPKTAAEHPRSIALRRRPAMLWADNETVEMAPMVHEIENSNCMLQLVRRTSPFKNATTQMMIPKVYAHDVESPADAF